MGNISRKKNIRDGSRKDAMKNKDNDDNTKIMIDGFLVRKTDRISICTSCVKVSGCECKANYLCTSAENWVKIKKKYKYKIFGKYRFNIYIRKKDAELHKKRV